MKKICTLLFCLLILTLVKAQDTLPNFSVLELAKDKVQISWINPFTNCSELVVQRSYDSTRFFVSIFSAQSPALPQNGFIDKEVAPGVKAFYRIFYVLEGGNYFFTKSVSSINKKTVQKTVITTTDNLTNNLPNDNNGKPLTPSKMGKEEVKKKFITVYKQTIDTILRTIEVSLYKKFKDSISYKTKDTLFSFSSDEFIWKPFIPKPVWKPSTYIFTTEKGWVKIALPSFKQAHYSIKFFEENQKPIFEIKHLKEDTLTLDKANFFHSGWFYFELYENEKLKEKNKFFIGRDF